MGLECVCHADIVVGEQGRRASGDDVERLPARGQRSDLR